MKYIFTFLFFTFFALICKAQLYYNFNAVAGVYTTINSIANGGNATQAPIMLTSAGTGYLASDEGYANNIPIGFTFQFDGINYTSINANTNGFASFGTPFFTDATSFDRAYYKNSLTNGTPFFQYITPIVAPLWDDLAITATGSISYQTDGIAPNRVFTLQWDKMQWQNLGTAVPTISFQLKLYETSNKIEYVYNQETGSVSSGSTASIGLSSFVAYNAGGDVGSFVSLQSVSNNPTLSSTIETTTLNSKPATGQIYSFTPDPCAPPNGLRTSGYNHNTVTYSWTALAGSNGYQIAVDNSVTPPANGTSAGNSIAYQQGGLLAATNYYIHVKNACGTAWRTISFKTAETPAALPLKEGFEIIENGEVPTNWRTENISSPLEDARWEGVTDETSAATGTNFLLTWAPWVDADQWVYTPSLLLSAGKQYMLRFKYAIAGGGVHSMQVKMGGKVGKDSMNTLLFSDTNIINDLNNGAPYIDTLIFFTPAASGIYYIGFNYNATVAKSLGGYLLLDDVSVLENIVLPVNLLSFYGEAKNNLHKLHWATATEQNNKGFELQQSADGFSFQQIGWMASLASSGNSANRLSYTYSNLSLLPGINYYRLKQIDKDGKINLSPIVQLENKRKSGWAVSIYPNPVAEVANVVVNSTIAETVQLSLFSAEGKMVWAKKQILQTGKQSIEISLKTLPGGTYRLMVQGSERTNITIIKK